MIECAGNTNITFDPGIGRLSKPGLISFAGGVLLFHHQDEDTAVGVEAASGCRTGCGDGVGGGYVGALRDEAGAR